MSAAAATTCAVSAVGCWPTCLLFELVNHKYELRRINPAAEERWREIRGDPHRMACNKKLKWKASHRLCSVLFCYFHSILILWNCILVFVFDTHHNWLRYTRRIPLVRTATATKVNSIGFTEIMARDELIGWWCACVCVCNRRSVLATVPKKIEKSFTFGAFKERIEHSLLMRYVAKRR